MTSSDFSYLFSCFTVGYTVLSGIYKLLGYRKPLSYQMPSNKKLQPMTQALPLDETHLDAVRGLI